MADFLTLDQVDTEGEFYGVKVCRMGEDLDMGEVAFTHDRRRAIAAVRALYRGEGEKLMDVSTRPPEWWRVVDNCGCGDACSCPKDEDGYPEHECQHHGLPPCQTEYSWSGLACKADDPGALPVIQLEVGLW